MHRRTGRYYKHNITAENHTPMDSSNIKDGFILQIRFVEIRLGERKKVGNGEGGGELFQKLNRWERM